MLQLISALFNDPAADEATMLVQLRKESVELPEWSAAVQPILTRLLAHNALARPMVSCVLDMPFNALALPHKTIVVAQSLVEFCRHERDQLAFVLAHEAAHIHLGHAAERARANALASLLRLANPFVGYGLRFLMDRAFSREQEFEADRLALTLCARAGYAPQAGIAFLESLSTLDGSTGVRRFLDTHPPMRERVSQLRSIVGVRP